MGVKKIGRICTLVISFGLTLASIIMLGVFANLRCSMKSSDGLSETCPSNDENLTKFHIASLKLEAEREGITYIGEIYYPWHDRDVALGQAALTISLIFLVLVSLRGRFKSSKMAFARVCIGSLGFILLLVATKWMFVDLYDIKLPDNIYESNYSITLSRSPYLANAILVSLTCVFVFGLTAWETQKYIKFVHKQEEKGQTDNEVQPRISPSSPKSHKIFLITSLIVTFLLALAAIILFGVLAKSKCSIEYIDGSSEGCSDYDPFACRDDVFYHSWNVSDESTLELICGWHPRDVGLTEAALGVSLIFVALMTFRGFLNSSKLRLLRIYIGVISVILLVSAIILVSADFSGKMSPQPDLPKSLPDEDGFVDKGNRFRANIILVVLTCAFVSGLTAWDFKLYLKTGFNYDQNRTAKNDKPKRSKAPLFMALAITFGLSLASFIMFGILSIKRCSIDFDNTTTSCDAEDFDVNCENINSVRFNFGPDEDRMYVSVDCPWNDRDLGLGEAALGISLFFMIFVALRNSIKSLSLALTRVCTGLFSSLLLIAAVILMFVDLFDAEEVPEGVSASRKAYVANGVLVILTCVFVIGLSIREISNFVRQVRNNSQGYKKAPQASTPQLVEMQQKI